MSSKDHQYYDRTRGYDDGNRISTVPPLKEAIVSPSVTTFNIKEPYAENIKAILATLHTLYKTYPTLLDDTNNHIRKLPYSEDLRLLDAKGMLEAWTVLLSEKPQTAAIKTPGSVNARKIYEPLYKDFAFFDEEVNMIPGIEDIVGTYPLRKYEINGKIKGANIGHIIKAILEAKCPKKPVGQKDHLTGAMSVVDFWVDVDDLVGSVFVEKLIQSNSHKESVLKLATTIPGESARCYPKDVAARLKDKIVAQIKEQVQGKTPKTPKK